MADERASQIGLRELFPQGLKTAIFDMDDLLVHTRIVDGMAMADVMRQPEYGIDRDWAELFTPEEELSLIGRKVDKWFELLVTTYDLDPSTDISEMVNGFNEVTTERMESDETVLEPMPGVVELIKSLEASGFTLVLASSAGRKKINKVLEKTGLTKFFKKDNKEMIVSGEDDGIEHGKPHPEIFERAAALAGVDPSECVVFEDAKNGVEAAVAANIGYVVGVHNQFIFKRLRKKQNLEAAHLSVDSFRQLAYT